MEIRNWTGKSENTTIEYTDSVNANEVFAPISSFCASYDDEIRADKVDCLVAASSGMLTALIDVLWVGEFSLQAAQDNGTDKINNLVVFIAQSKGCRKSDLKACIAFLEDKFPMASDKLTSTFGGGLQHHLRDFSHHASPYGLICSILNQFVNKAYGTNTDGEFITPELPTSKAIGNTFNEKIWWGVVNWFFHLVSDMAGSSGSNGRGTGIPGPLLSFAKVLSATPLFRELNVKYKGDDIGFSVWISKLFNGTAFEHSSNKDLVRFDLRTELGAGIFAAKQAVPVLVNWCIVRSFYIIRRLAQEYSEKHIQTITDLKKIDTNRVFSTDSRCINRMFTISTGVFMVVDGADAAFRSKLRNPNDNGQFITDLLLRVNFIGIGAFAISVKREAQYAISDVKGFMKKKTKAQIILDTEMQNETSMEIEMDMDNGFIYQYTFDELLNMIRMSRESHIESHDDIKTSMGAIFDLGDDDYDIHNSLVRSNECRVEKAIERLTVKLFEQNNIAFDFYPIDAIYTKMDCLEQAKSRPFQIIMTTKNRTTGVVFCNYKDVGKYKELFMNGCFDVDTLQLVLLSEPDQNAYQYLFVEENKKCQKAGIAVERITLKEFFSNYLGEDEYDAFITYSNAFNKEAREIIGFDTVITPTDKAIAGFKEKTGAMLRDYSYKENLPSDIFPSQSNLLIHNYLERGLWKAMIGNSTFAASFLSSEWNYTIYKLSDNLDLTGIITGYLKSVEQLLYAILSLSSDTGATAKTRDGRIVSFSTENEDIDTTLKSLEMTMQHNNALWDTTPYVKRYVIEAIDEWRRTQRNGYFHKHNLYSVEAVKEIREKVIFLYFLILGACSIKDDQFDAIGIIPQNQQELDFSYNSFVQWVEPILKYGFPKTTVAISFNLYASKTLGWEIQLTTTSLFDVNNERWNWNPVYSSGHNIYSWGTPITELPTKDEEAAAIKIVYQALQQYIESGTYAEKLSCYKAVSISGARSTEFVYMSSSC